MKIDDMFLKDIHRNIEGVITASKVNDEQVYQELDEYVVTKELQGHFKTFFDAYKKGVLGDTSKIGVWIQGFFGSGKSHFLKILSYILENKEINGKTAFDFFTEGDEGTRKIKDDMTIADMRLATITPTNVILFNVESKHQTGTEEKNSLVNVFLKVFNDSLGFSTIPQLADLERDLSKKGKFEVFKRAFEAEQGESWEESRHEIDFLEDEVVDALVAVDYFSETAARNWFAKYEKDYQISIEDFAELVEEHLQSKENNEHIVFLVDEIGQYIGGNRSLTLQLQTIVEELGNKSRGKAWVIVTSQELIDAVTDISGSAATDFSKIKGRFETTLSLSSANADEVIQKRILAKNTSGQQFLEADYSNHASNLKLMLQFEDSPELKLFNDAKNYADVFPFIPYQFNLLANILTQISKHSIQGSNLSRGERSLLAFFKETAERNAESDSQSLVSLDQFYPSLEKWLNETKNNAVIKQASENSRIVSGNGDNFNIDVLKVLFMIKYVDQNVKPTLNNITNLLISRVDEDKMALRKKVQIALKVLINENLIRQNLQSYVFQTDEEQEVTRLINNIDLSAADVENKLAVDIFEDKVGKNSFSYKNRNAVGKTFENRYNFSYNRYIDDYMHGKSINPQLEVKIITPYYDGLWSDETQLIYQSTKNQLLINVPFDQEFMNHMSTYIKVERYVTTTTTNSAIRNFAAVKAEKTTENQDLNASIQNQLSEFLKEASFYFNNNTLEVSGSDFKARLTDALQQMAKLVYHKNELIDSAITEADINGLLRQSGDAFVAQTDNQNAIEEVKRYIQIQQGKNLTITMKTLRDYFVGKEPYGFVNEDIEWAIARLFKEGNLILFKNAIPLSTTDDVSEISKSIFERKSPEKIRIELRQKANETQKSLVKSLGLELFNSKNIVDDSNDDNTHLRFVDRTQKMIAEFTGYISEAGAHYPQTEVINKALKILRQIIAARDTSAFFEVLKEKEADLRDWAEDLEDIKNFHVSNQKTLWNKSRDYIERIEGSMIKESTPAIDSILSEMKAILKQSVPYKSIPELGRLNGAFETEYMAFMDAKTKIAADKIESIKQSVLEDLGSRDFEDTFKNEAVSEFDKLIRALDTYQKIDQIELAAVQAESLQRNFINKFTLEENRRREAAARIEEQEVQETPAENNDDYVPAEKQKLKKIETVYVKSLIKQSSRIGSESDIDAFINDLKAELLAQLKNDIELDIRP